MKLKAFRNRVLAITATLFVALFLITAPLNAATLATQKPSTAGIAVVYTAAAGSQDFVNTGKEFVHVKNGAGAPITVTFTAAGKDNFGITSTAHDLVVTVPATDDRIIGPFLPERYNTTAGKVAVGYSSTTTVTVAVIKGS